jgi:hypothetical protein
MRCQRQHFTHAILNEVVSVFVFDVTLKAIVLSLEKLDPCSILVVLDMSGRLVPATQCTVESNI